jgi:3-deoxy-D-manno-octulosonic-acid transferase
LEPLIARIPVMFGPIMHNFTLIRQVVLDAQAGIELASPKELPARVMELLSQRDVYEQMQEQGDACIRLFKGNKQRFTEALYRLVGV